MNKATAKVVGLGEAKRMTGGDRVLFVHARFIPLYTTPNVAEQLTFKAKLRHRYQQAKWGLKEWLMGHYRRHAYRHVQRLLHKFDLHYMPGRARIDGDLPHERHHWCQWCGLRGTTYVSTPDDPLRPNEQD